MKYLKSKKINKKLMFFLTSSILLCLFLICCLIIDLETKDIKNQQNIISTLSQIQIAIFTLVFTILSILIGFFNEYIYGIRFKALLKLRKGINISLLTGIIILFIFTSITIISIIFNLFYCLLLMLIFTIIICIWLFVQYLPLCFINDKALIKLIKKNMKENILMNGLNNTETMNTLVLNLIIEKKINEIYKLLKNKEKNKEIIDYFFNLIINKLASFKHLNDNQQYKKEVIGLVNNIIDNVDLLFESKTTIFSDYEEVKKLSIYLARIFNIINNIKDLLDVETIRKVENVFLSMAFFLCIKDEGQETKITLRKEIVFNTYQQLIIISFCKCDLWVAKLFKRFFSRYHYAFSSQKYINILFSEISFLLFYHYKEANISKKIKLEIKAFVNEKEDYSITEKGLSWKELFKQHLMNYSIKINDLYEYIPLEQFELLSYNIVKPNIVTKRIIAEWWLKCLFYSDKFFEYNFDFLKEIKNNEAECLVYYLDEILNNDEKIDTNKISESFSSFENFFDLDKNIINEFNYIYENEIKTLYSFKNSFKKQKEKLETPKELQTLQKELLDKLKNFFDSISLDFGNKKMSLSKIKSKEFYILEEMYNFVNVNDIYLYSIKNSIYKYFYNDFEQQMSTSCIVFDDKLNKEKLEKILSANISFTTQKVMHFLKIKKYDFGNLIPKLEILDNNIEVIKTSILLRPFCYGNKKAVKFNYEIESFELKKLKEEDILKIMDKYKAQNGTYFYNGVQYSYIELLDLLKLKLFTIRFRLKYKIKYDKNNLFYFNPWGTDKNK